MEMLITAGGPRSLRRHRKEVTVNLTGKYKKGFLVVLSFLYLVLAVLLIAAVIGIYREGSAAKAVDPLEWIYSESRIAENLRPILPLFFLTIGASAAGFVIGVKDDKGLFMDAKNQKRLFMGVKNQNRLAMGAKNQKRLAVGGMDKKELKPAKSGKITHPDTAAGGSTLREAQKNVQQKAQQKTLRMILLIAAVILIAAGVYNGSATDVFGKAIKICTECVGIG